MQLLRFLPQRLRLFLHLWTSRHNHPDKELRLPRLFFTIPDFLPKLLLRNRIISLTIVRSHTRPRPHQLPNQPISHRIFRNLPRKPHNTLPKQSSPLLQIIRLPITHQKTMPQAPTIPSPQPILRHSNFGLPSVFESLGISSLRSPLRHSSFGLPWVFGSLGISSFRKMYSSKKLPLHP